MTALAHVSNLAECDRSTQLAAVAESGACEAGRVIMLDFSLVREKVGLRWAARCEGIWDHTERTIKRHLLSTAIFCRADQSSYLICFSDMDRLGAQALSFRIMEDVITHFLGSCSPKDLMVKTVSSVSDSEIIASTVPFSNEHLNHTPVLGAGAAAYSVGPSSPGLIHDIDDQLQQSFGFDRVFNLKIDKPVAIRVSSSLIEPLTRRPLKTPELAALATRQLLKADLNTFQMLNYLCNNMPPKMIVAPLSVQSLSHTTSRAALLECLARLDSATKSRVIIELYGFEDGMPPSRFLETATLLKPFCRSIMTRITSSRSAILNVRAARPTAANVNAPDTGGNHSKLAASLLAIGQAVRGVAPTLMVTDLPDATFLSVCAVAGWTHASVRSIAAMPDGA